MRKLHLWIMIGLAGCGALSQKSANELRDKYIEQTRNLDLFPVYPPSEELQVGDVYFVSHPDGKPDDIDNRTQIYLGTVQEVRRLANRYLATRINLKDSGSHIGSGPSTLVQEDFSNGAVSTNNIARTSLPLVTYPAIEGSAGAALAFGGFAFAGSSVLGFGTTESVSVDFGDTRVYGLQRGGIGLLTDEFKAEYKSKICNNSNVAKGHKRAFLDLHARQFVKLTNSPSSSHIKLVEDKNQLCAEGRKCYISIVTRTITTRKIEFTYSGATFANAATARARGELPAAPQRTLDVPQPPTVNLTIDKEADAEAIKAVLDGLGVRPTSGTPATPTSSIQFVGFQGSTARFVRPLQKPVAIAHEAVTYNLDGNIPSCGYAINKETGIIDESENN